MFYVGVQLNDAGVIPEGGIVRVPCEDFRLPPQGTSKDSDFDMLCHLELEPEKVEKKKGDEDEEEVGEVVEEEPEKKEALGVPRI